MISQHTEQTIRTYKQYIQNNIYNSNLNITIMKWFKIFDMIKCFFEKKSDRCEGCQLEQAAKSLPYGIKENAEALMNTILEPVREMYGKPVFIINGFCCPVRLRMIGESVKSPLVKGEAVDITAVPQPGMTEHELAMENLELARCVLKVGGFDVMLLGDVEKDSIEPKWIKVAWKRNGENLGMVLKKRRGSGAYENLSRLDFQQLLTE